MASLYPPVAFEGQAPVDAEPVLLQKVKVLAVFGIVLGSLAVAFNIVRAALVLIVLQQGMAPAADVTRLQWGIGGYAANGIVGVAFVIGAVGLLYRRAWGRTVSIAAAGLRIVLGVVVLGVLVYDATGAPTGQTPEEVGFLIGTIVGGSCAELLAMAYPVAVLIILLPPRSMTTEATPQAVAREPWEVG